MKKQTDTIVTTDGMSVTIIPFLKKETDIEFALNKGISALRSEIYRNKSFKNEAINKGLATYRDFRKMDNLCSDDERALKILEELIQKEKKNTQK